MRVARRTRWLWTGVALSVLTAAAPGHAQTTPADRPPAADAQDASTPGDIIVTARRVEERLQDVPISITVFNQQQLSNRNVVNASDLANYTPSLSANSNFGGDNSTFAIRGFVQDVGTSPSVGVYFADVVAPRGASNNIPVGDGAGPGSFFDLQNVQVLKGPQGTLFGRNTTGGAVLLVPQKPTDKLEGYVEGSYGNFDMWRVQGVINTPLGDNARLRIGVDHETRDGYAINDTGVGSSRFNDIDYTAVRGSLVVDLTPDLENYTIVSYLRSDNNGPAQKLVACNPSTAPANLLGILACAQLSQEQAKGAGFYTVQSTLPNTGSDLEQWQVINTTTWRASDSLTIKNVTSYAQLRDDLRSPLFGTNFDLHNFNPAFPAGTTILFASSNPLPGHATANQSTFTEEFQLQGHALSNRLTWQAGAYLEISDPLGLSGSQGARLLSCVNSATFNCTNPLGSGTVNYNAGVTRYHDVGLYAQGSYEFTDKLKLTGGIRYTWDRAANDSTLIAYKIISPTVKTASCVNPTTVNDGCDLHIRERSQAPTWLVDLDYKPIDAILLYAKYSRGYRSGGVAPNVPTQFDSFKAEKVDAYEAGIKTTIRGPVRGTFNVAGFYNDFSNQQLQLGFFPNPGAPVAPSSGIVNAGKSRIYGVEVETALQLFRGFELDGSYTYLNTRLQSIDIPPSAPGSAYSIAAGALSAGDQLTLSPKNKYTVTGTYTLPLDSSIGKVSVGATFTHTDSQIVNYADVLSPNPLVAALGRLDARNLLNLNLSWNSVVGLPVDLSLFATNVTKQQYYTFVPGIYGGAGFETAQLGEPRMVGARLRYRFGS
jgi:iron complex outermembrane receptor protein